MTITAVIAGAGLMQQARAQVSVIPAPNPAQVAEQDLQGIEVTGTRATSSLEVPQAVDTIDAATLSQQHLTRLTDALRNVPGITLNSGEGGAHGDSVNLRGLSVPDSFFIDGLRDIGQYGRDTFDDDQISVLLGPSSILFGRGSTAGVINAVSKTPELEDEVDATLSVGSAGLSRATADLNHQLGDTGALRLNLMGEQSGVVERNDVVNRRSGIAPALLIGAGTDTRLEVNLYHLSEDNTPDYGIPFVDGRPAPVDRSNYYGLVNFDRTRTENNIFTARVDHDFNDALTITNTLRAARYGFAYILSGPHLDDDFTAPPTPSEPLADIPVYRDQPSSTGTVTAVIDRLDLSADFHTGPLTHALIAGLELSRETSQITRYFNGIDIDAPTSIIVPNPYNAPPTPLVGVSFPNSVGTDVSLYSVDQIGLARHWDVDVGVRFDRFDSGFSDRASGTAFSRSDSEVSPRAALVYKPAPLQSYYLSYGTSYNPGIEYLVYAPSNQSLAPEQDRTAELGAKWVFAGGKVLLSANLFDTRLDHARNADPDDPLIQQQPFDQTVRGFETGAHGALTDRLTLLVGFTHLASKITTATDPLADNKVAPNSPANAANLWLDYRLGASWHVGAGADYVGHRYADTHDSASVPSYVVGNLMGSWQIDQDLMLQANLNNISNKLYYSGVYFSSIDENHAVPGPGRTLIVSLNLHF